MFELYKKVNKSIEYPKGARQILEGENPFEDGPCLLCISAQNQANSQAGYYRCCKEHKAVSVDRPRRFSFRGRPE